MAKYEDADTSEETWETQPPSYETAASELVQDAAGLTGTDLVSIYSSYYK